MEENPEKDLKKGYITNSLFRPISVYDLMEYLSAKGFT